MDVYKEIFECRICGNPELESLLGLGEQALTGIFPKQGSDDVPVAPLHLVKCAEEGKGGACGLVQLRHSYDLECLYGMNYGYRSGLNASMVAHLNEMAETIKQKVSLSAGDIALDIGSNDGTLLRAMDEPGIELAGFDPTGEKFKQYYPPHVRLIPDFFSSSLFRREFGDRKAKVVTSIAMFYDLESPLDFMRQVGEVLDDNGIWVFEQSYLLSMLEMNSYDMICQEHLEYYSLKQIKFMMDRAGFKIIDIEFNDTNGGSFCVTAAKAKSPLEENRPLISQILGEETRRGLRGKEIYEQFRLRVFQHREELKRFLETMASQNQRLLGYGASTKGNVILQFCGITSKEMPFIAEVNQDKFGCVTPGTKIPIISEAEAKAMNPNGFLVLPWHFKKHIVRREKDFLESGGRLVFPLPELEVVSKADRTSHASDALAKERTGTK